MAAIDKTYINDWTVFNKIRNWAIDKSFVLKNGQRIHLRDYMYYPNLTKKEWDEMHDSAIQYANEHYNTPEYKAQAKELYGDDWTFDAEKYFDVVLWNTPKYVDIWLIRNCPFDEIQDRLKEQYSGGWSKEAFTTHNDDDMYMQIKEYRSVYDTYQRNGLGYNANVNFHNIWGSWCRDKNCHWFVEVNPYWINGKRTEFDVEDSYSYNEQTDSWYKNDEAMPITTTTFHHKGYLSKKKIVRMIKKWNLPKNTIVKFENTMVIKNKGRYLMHEFYCTVN